MYYMCVCVLSRVWLFATPWTARLLCPWNFPGKNAGVGCHFLLQGNFLTQGLNLCLLLWQADCVPLCHLKSPVYYMKSESESHSVVSDSLRPHGLFSPWNSLGQNTGVSSLSLLQGIFPTQGSNPGLLHCKQILNIWASREAEPFIAPSFSNFWEVFAFVFAQDMSSWVVFRECRSRISSFSVTWELQRKTNSWTLLEGLSIRNSVDGAQVSGF